MGQGSERDPDHRHTGAALGTAWWSPRASSARDAATEDRNYAFLRQLTHITRGRGAHTHYDRVDAVAGAGAHFQRAMMVDVD
jgi:hypothetical protein